MHRKPRTVELTPRQIAETLAALRSHVAALSKQEDEDPQGDEVHDILTAESVIKILMKAGADADQGDYPATRQPE
jgi:phage I-like protein